MHHRGFFGFHHGGHGRHHDFSHRGPFGVWTPHHRCPPDWPRHQFGPPGRHEEQIRRIVSEFFQQAGHPVPERRECGLFDRVRGRHVECDPWRLHGRRRRNSCPCNRAGVPGQTAAGSSCDNLPRCYRRRHGGPCPKHSGEGTLPGGKSAAGSQCDKRNCCTRLRKSKKSCCGECCRIVSESGPNNDLPTSATDETDPECETAIIDLDNDADNSKKSS